MGSVSQTLIFVKHRKPSWQPLLAVCPYTLLSQELGPVLCDPQADGNQHHSHVMPRLKSAGALAWQNVSQGKLCWMLTLL